MPKALMAFSSLYFAALLMLLGSGLLTTWLGLRLNQQGVGEFWIGLMMAAYYLGLVAGASVGHRLIARVGHIRAFVASAGVVTASVLGHALLETTGFWLLLRLLVGMGMMCQYMVVESWLNEQAESHQRGMVFASYMVVTFLGTVLGQIVLTIMPDLDIRHLLMVAMCFSLCLVPVAVTRRIHPAPLHPAPLKVRLFIERIPQALTSVLVSGLLVGAFYGLAPVFAASSGLQTAEVGLFMAVTVGAGLLAQWPVGWLSDRLDRSRMIQLNAIILTGVTLLISLGVLDSGATLALTAIFGLLAFTLYPLAVALANDHVEQEERVPLSAMLLLTFGVGASIGPVAASVLMGQWGPGMLYVFMACCTLVLMVRVRPEQVTGEHLVDEAPLNFMPAAGNLASSPLAAALDPRVDEQMVVEQMVDEEALQQREGDIAEEVVVDADGDEHRPG